MLSDRNKMWTTHVILNFLVGETNINIISYLTLYILDSITPRCNQYKIINDIVCMLFFSAKIPSAQ